MERDENAVANTGSGNRQPAIRFLVESALRQVISDKGNVKPESRRDWIEHLAEALMSDSDASYQSVLSSLMANGVSSEEIYQRYVPDAARLLGELWVSDKASFVDVTVGAARLQRLFRSEDRASGVDWISRSIPLGHSVLMIIPQFEKHSLGAFVAADDLRRHGLWVRMSIYLEGDELLQLLKSESFSMLGFSLGTPESVDRAREMVDFIRKNIDHVPPIVIGGHALELVEDIVARCDADFAAGSASEALELCGLPSVVQMPGFDELSA